MEKVVERELKKGTAIDETTELLEQVRQRLEKAEEETGLGRQIAACADVARALCMTADCLGGLILAKSEDHKAALVTTIHPYMVMTTLTGMAVQARGLHQRLTLLQGAVTDLEEEAHTTTGE